MRVLNKLQKYIMESEKYHGNNYTWLAGGFLKAWDG
jgi:hypothetical protein